MVAAAALTTSLGLISAISPVAYAQDATPSAPIVVCNSPGLPPGEPSASPAAGMGDMDMAAPAASPVVEEQAGTVADETTTAEATAAAQNVVACSIDSTELFLALMSGDFLLQQFGTDNPYDVLASGALEGFSFGDFSTGAVYTYPDGSVSVDVQYLQSQYQVVGERWFFTGAPGSWVLDSLSPITPNIDGDTAVVGVTLSDYAFEFNVAQIVQPEVLMLHLINGGAEAHEMVIFRGSDTVTVDNVVADAEGTLSTAEFIGALEVPVPGQQADLALVGLEPGKYVVVCFIPDANGTPHFLEGMVGEFEILGL